MEMDDPFHVLTALPSGEERSMLLREQTDRVGDIPDCAVCQIVSGTISRSIDFQNIIAQFVLQLRGVQTGTAKVSALILLIFLNFLTPNVPSIIIY